MNTNNDPNFHREHFNSVEEHEKINRYVEITAQYINLFANSESNILDVGGSDGIMQKFLKFKTIKSIDLYPASEKVQQGTIYEEQDGKYDLVVYNHVLEHIWNGYEEMKEAKKKLKKGGYIFVSTPYFTAPFAYELQGHVALYNKEILVKLCEELDMIAIEYTLHNFREDKTEQWFVMQKK